MKRTVNTVCDELRKFCEEYGCPFEEYLKVWLMGKVDTSVPERYKRLLLEVALSLPAGWDDHAAWTCASSATRNSNAS
jgi:hypothetical protein